MSDAVVDQLVRKIGEAEAEQARLVGQIRELRGRIAGLRQALSMIQKSPIEVKDDPDRDKCARYESKRVRRSRLPNPDTNPRWRFMLDLVSAAPASGISVESVVNETNRAGHELTSNVARSFLSVAAQEGLIQRVSVGHYCGKNSNGPDAETSGPSFNSLGDAGSPGELPRQDLPDGSTPSSSTTHPQLRLATR